MAKVVGFAIRHRPTDSIVNFKSVGNAFYTRKADATRRLNACKGLVEKLIEYDIVELVVLEKPIWPNK